MEKMIPKKVAYYPGCSSESSSRMYESSLQQVMKALEVELVEIPDWSCCGASSCHVLDEAVTVALSSRNLAIAEEMGFTEVMTGCAACFFHLRSAQHAILEKPELAKTVNEALEKPCTGKGKIYNLLELLLLCMKEKKELPATKRTFDHLKPVCYYGCLFMRVPGELDYDSVENPTAMEQILEKVGIHCLDWAYKTDCCGASAVITAPDTAFKLMSKILSDAQARGANAIVTACPMCQLNLDLYMKQSCEKNQQKFNPPVFFITQLVGLAWGATPQKMELDRLLSGQEILSEVLA